MRISDWSSDVCSSDLECIFTAMAGKARLQLPLERIEIGVDFGSKCRHGLFPRASIYLVTHRRQINCDGPLDRRVRPTNAAVRTVRLAHRGGRHGWADPPALPPPSARPFARRRSLRSAISGG